MRKLTGLICLLLAVCCAVPALAWDPDELFSFMDMSGEAPVSYDNVAWNFPVDIADLDPELIRLANKDCLLDEDFVPELVTMKRLKLDGEGRNTSGGVRMVDDVWKLHPDCAAALVLMCDAAREEGHELYLKSGYRSYRKQSTMYSNRLQKMGYDDGWVSKPGASDHQTGLGCDVVPRNWTDRGMNEKMAQEEECIWMAQNCARFGFILRYPEDKEDVTKINYEPWHLRYVGVPVATYIMENGLCLEEFHVELDAAIEDFLTRGGPAFLVEDLQ